MDLADENEVRPARNLPHTRMLTVFVPEPGRDERSHYRQCTGYAMFRLADI